MSAATRRNLLSRSCAATLTISAAALGCNYGSSSTVQVPEQTESTRGATSGLRGWHYEVTPSSSLTTADVRVCFEGSPPELLIPGIALGTEHTSDVRIDGGEALARKGRGYGLGPVPTDGCVRYRVDFDGLQNARGARRIVAARGRSLLARPSAWLWRPDMLPAGVQATIEFRMPEGMEISVPWPAHDKPATPHPTFTLDHTAFVWLGYAVFGTMTIDNFSTAGVDIELVTLDAPIACPPAGLRDWIIDAVDSVALLFDGTFPRDRLQVVVLPTEGGGGGTVYFGMASRGGGPGVFVFLDDEAKAEALPGGWTTVHEFLHHGMPFIDEAWMAEGWVSYYTEIMRTRAGHRSEQEGWAALHEAFERGGQRDGSMTLAEASEGMHEHHNYQRVYWGGAAVAFLIDVQMRLDSDGTRGLDDAMKELRRCCGDADHQWPAQELLTHLDAWHGSPLFTQTAKSVLEAKSMPDIDEAMARLGIDTSGSLRLDDEHPAAAARRAIMAPRP